MSETWYRSDAVWFSEKSTQVILVSQLHSSWKATTVSMLDQVTVQYWWPSYVFVCLLEKSGLENWRKGIVRFFGKTLARFFDYTAMYMWLGKSYVLLSGQKHY